MLIFLNRLAIFTENCALAHRWWIYASISQRLLHIRSLWMRFQYPKGWFTSMIDMCMLQYPNGCCIYVRFECASISQRLLHMRFMRVNIRMLFHVEHVTWNLWRSRNPYLGWVIDTNDHADIGPLLRAVAQPFTLLRLGKVDEWSCEHRSLT